MAPRVIEQKLESLRRCLLRIRQTCPEDSKVLQSNADAQDILTLNLTRAVQIAVDIGAHLLVQEEAPPPGTMGETFDRLCELGIVDVRLADRMKRAVGFRNLAIHNYEEINWAIVHTICTKHLTDFEDFARAVLEPRS